MQTRKNQILGIGAMALVILAGACQKASMEGDYMPKMEILQLEDPAMARIEKPVVFKSWGSMEDLQEQLNAFRSAIGGTLNTTPGAAGGRREINWDGVPEGLTNNNFFPGNFFAQTDPLIPNDRKQGVTLLSLFGFRVSDKDFSDIDPSYADAFEAFSPARTFMPVYGIFTELQFKVPGTNRRAYVESFGVVFSDVDGGNSATIELFTDHDKSLGVFMAHPQSGRGKFSFLGVRIPGAQITRVLIRSGQAPLGPGSKDISQGGMYDFVVMDDFLYSEPVELQ
jgi:hypothetical protein